MGHCSWLKSHPIRRPDVVPMSGIGPAACSNPRQRAPHTFEWCPLSRVRTGSAKLIELCAVSSRGAVAQWSEQGTHNPLVEGSIPSGPTHIPLRDEQSYLADAAEVEMELYLGALSTCTLCTQGRRPEAHRFPTPRARPSACLKPLPAPLRLTGRNDALEHRLLDRSYAHKLIPPTYCSSYRMATRRSYWRGNSFLPTHCRVRDCRHD